MLTHIHRTRGQESASQSDALKIMKTVIAHQHIQASIAQAMVPRTKSKHNFILNVASSGKFSSDRTIAEYAQEIWKVEPCPIP